MLVMPNVTRLTAPNPSLTTCSGFASLEASLPLAAPKRVFTVLAALNEHGLSQELEQCW